MDSDRTNTRSSHPLSPFDEILIIFLSNGLGPFQTCTLFGSESGSDIISGRNYLAVGYGLNPDDLWRRNFPLLIGFLVLFQLTQIIALEYFPVCLSSSCFVFILICVQAIWLPHVHEHLRKGGQGDYRTQ